MPYIKISNLQIRIYSISSFIFLINPYFLRFLMYYFKTLVLHLMEYRIEILLSNPLVVTKSAPNVEETTVVSTLMLQEASWGRINVAGPISLTMESFVSLATKMHHAKFHSLKTRFLILFMMRFT